MKTTLFASLACRSIGRASVLAILIAALGGGAQLASAATRTWTGGYFSGYWSAAANWDTGAPVAGDDLVFPPGAADLINTNNLGGVTFRSITFTGSGYTLRGSSIMLSEGITATAAGSLNTIELDITLGAAQTFECLYQ